MDNMSYEATVAFIIPLKILPENLCIQRWGKQKHMLSEWWVFLAIKKNEKKKMSHYIFICALDFVCPPGFSIIAVGHFVWLNIFWAPDTLGSLGYHSCDPHPPLQVNLREEHTQRERHRKRKVCYIIQCINMLIYTF